jgi:predicted transposase/invertase (TIGR01784 family)
MKLLPPELHENEHIRQAAELCKEAAFTENELNAYDAYWDAVRVERTLRYSFLREGLKKGEEKGEKKGEQKTLKRIVLNGKQNGFSIEQIQALTQLTAEQITEILKQENVV